MLQLSSNRLIGQVMPSLGGFASLCIVTSNQINGPLDPEIGNLKDLTRMDLSNNKLSGFILNRFMQLTEVQFLNLSHNAFSSHIAPDVGLLNQLKVVDLSRNT
ncbi:LOW QUALITY PROTEIN: LRR domain containing protein [Trema orientale]|uniref:LRR domain containing protein n=1 Tax=Trema orientale TaxID=63057 RepID=A0A2P5D233_TREOI|nr:LOW QUALITY PROTEIN: LRR domain containing protein [Trema orientale]